MGEWASSNGAFDRQRRGWQKIAMARNRTLKTHVTKSSNDADKEYNVENQRGITDTVV